MAASGLPYKTVSPTRVLDSRTGLGAPAGCIGPGATLDVQVGGRAGVPTSGVEAIAINLTAVAPGSGGHATVFPTGSAAPDTSNINFSAGQTVAGFALVQPGTDGRVSIRNVGGSADYLIDVSGFIATS